MGGQAEVPRGAEKRCRRPAAGIEERFDVSFVAPLAAREKQIQQVYRPAVGVHKWFARRPGTLFRALLLAEFCDEPPADAFAAGHSLGGITVADPFMGGGTTLVEANRMGARALGCDVNPMAWWVVRQTLSALDRDAFRAAVARVTTAVEKQVGELYRTQCRECGAPAVVKYFFWVKQQRCAGCNEDVDLFGSALVAKNDRHTHFVLHCPGCRQLVQLERLPERGHDAHCPECGEDFNWARGAAARSKVRCACGHEALYPDELAASAPPRHRLFGLEIDCEACRTSLPGRLFATPAPGDLERFERARKRLARRADLPLPDDEILVGDETRRLHRWGYARWRDLFNERQLLGLGLLLREIRVVKEPELRRALATVFSDFLRYQNLLCRYDLYALKCQDVFSLHGFPVGLAPCENNLLGIPGVGAGGFRHFAEKACRARAWCEAPWETPSSEGRRTRVATPGERVSAHFVTTPGELTRERSVLLHRGSIDDLSLDEESVDAVFTDPPYFGNVQYAELMDFCFAWLRLALAGEVAELDRKCSRSARELTGNATSGRDLAHFTEGISRVFRASARALRPGGPLVFTWHHNDAEAYAPLVVAILDAGLACTGALPAPAEMGASLHIHGTASSVLDTVFVCRKPRGPRRERKTKRGPARVGPATLRRWLARDRDALAAGGLDVREGDLRCLAFGHLARVAAAQLATGWDGSRATAARLDRARERLGGLAARCDVELQVSRALGR